MHFVGLKPIQKVRCQTCMLELPRKIKNNPTGVYLGLTKSMALDLMN